jgi:NAD(P)-dependent dehydrogenase (short-subunit alcohol dehydrogenase family)
MSIKGKIALITGSAGGIGKCTAELFAREGASLLICDIDPVALVATEKELKNLGAKVASVVYNARKTEDIDQVFKKLDEVYGDLDILVNNTGIAGPTKPIVEMSAEEWDETLEVNLRGAFYCIKKAAPYMIKKNSGKIVSLSSQSGKKSLPNRSPYDASKMGVIGLTRCAADELGGHNINVNAVCPGAVEGPRLDKVFEGQSKSRGITAVQAREEFTKPAFLKRTVPPQDVAQLILFLSDDDRSRSVTGQDFNVNCGTITY